MTRIALFGGSFNPPHAAHQLVALYALETQPIDELWFVPTYAHPFGKQLASYDHRIAMCELAAAPLGPRARVSRAEAELAARPGFVASHTLALLEYLAAPDRTLRLVIGGDILGQTAKWHRWADVVAAAPLIVIGRSGHPLPPGSTATEITMPDISASRVRELLAAGPPAVDPVSGEVSGLVPASVLRYIAEHELYKP
jgi:nicotinate-nucleotide adenylyltransferase